MHFTQEEYKQRLLKVKTVDVNFEEAQDLARDYNDGLVGQAKIAI